MSESLSQNSISKDFQQRELTTAHGTRLYIESGRRHLIAASEEQACLNRFVPVYSTFLYGGRHVALLSGDHSNFLISPSTFLNPIQLLRCVKHADTEHWRLMCPVTYQYVSAAPFDPALGFGTISADRTAFGAWEIFIAEDLTDKAFDEGNHQAVSTINKIMSAENQADSIIEHIVENENQSAEVINATTPGLSVDDWEALASEYILNPAFRRNLGLIFKSDVWATKSLPDLISWDRARPLQNPIIRLRDVPATLDFISQAGKVGSPISFSHTVNHFARRRADPMRGTCVVATARNEGAYLIEWVAYHKALGFEEIFIYTNDNDDGSDQLLRTLAENGLIVWLKNHVGVGTRTQSKVYCHALSIMPDILDYRWALFIDLDEFFVFDPEIFSSLSEFIRFHESRETDVVAINWTPVGSDGVDEWVNKPLTERFTMLIEDGINPHVKSLFKPNKFSFSGPHNPDDLYVNSSLYRDSRGRIHEYRKPKRGPSGIAVSDEPNVDFAAVYHYFYKSAQEFLWKCSRNRGSQPKVEKGESGLNQGMLGLFMAQHATENKRVEARLRRCVPDLKSRMNAILALPGVQQQYDRVVETFSRSLQSILLGHAVRTASRPISDLEKRFLQHARVPHIPPL